jgi:hypothetical protein
MTVEWINTDEALVELCAHLGSQPFVAVREVEGAADDESLRKG